METYDPQAIETKWQQLWESENAFHTPNAGPEDRDAYYVPPNAIPSQHLLPLEEIIAATFRQRTNTKKVNVEYDRLLERYGSELRILLDLPEEELADGTPSRIVDGIMKVRRGEVQITPGYDGEYGKIELFSS